MKLAKKMTKKNKQVSIKRMIHERVAGSEKGRSIATIHASSVTKQDPPFCPRQYALMDISKTKPKDQFIGTSMRITFDTGSALQAMLNEHWLADVMFGDWRCRSCGETFICSSKPKGHCGRSGINCNWEYEEMRVTDPVSGISGGVDALIKTEAVKLRLLEVKTIDKDQFKELKAPLAEHRDRTNMYLKLVEADTHPFTSQINTKVAHILYICKGFGIKDTEITKHPSVKDQAFSPFKEFVIKRDDDETEHYFELARLLNDFRNGIGVMPTGICKSSFDKTAKSCPVMKECWSGKYPSGTK